MDEMTVKRRAHDETMDAIRFRIAVSLPLDHIPDDTCICPE
jgi:hypothetical protein